MTPYPEVETRREAGLLRPPRVDATPVGGHNLLT
jgi:hypothetical protein